MTSLVMGWPATRISPGGGFDRNHRTVDSQQELLRGAAEEEFPDLGATAHADDDKVGLRLGHHLQDALSRVRASGELA